MALPYPEGTAALASDSEQRALHKIVQLLNDGAGGGALADAQVFKSTSDPSGSPGVTAAIHYRTDNGAVWTWSGSTWTQIIAPGS
jgi:hypothetical protein